MAASSKHSFLPPPAQHSGHRLSIRDRLPKRYSRFIFILLGFLACFSIPKIWHYCTRPVPPLYSEYHFNELALPQHDPDLPYPEGKAGKYLWISEHTFATGFGNSLQEHFLNGLLAYESGRSFVFENYTWSRKGPYATFNGNLIPAQIPLTAFISGPLAGGPFASGDKTPRPVHREYFEKVCPDVTVFGHAAVKDSLKEDFTALEIMHAWLTKLEETPDRCVEIKDPIFDYLVFGSTRVLDIMPALFESPMIKLFRWSPLILRTFEQNSTLFAPHGLPPATSSDPYPVIPGLLALHIRRGDFSHHCNHLIKWSSTYTGPNQMPGLIDHFDVPPTDSKGKQTKAGRQEYLTRCYPSIAQIAEKVYNIRQTEEGTKLKNIFLMTNGQPDWIADLKAALYQTGDWDLVASSRDMTLTAEQKFVSSAVDMLIAQRADVFIGNGFSSLTSNVVMLRTARELTAGRTRFW